MPVDFAQHGRVALITLNRPEKLNAIDGAMMAQLSAAWQRVRDDDDIWAAIITGAGDRAFCSGRDLLADAPGSPAHHRAARAQGTAAEHGELAYLPRDLWKPLIAAVNGYALAGGFSLALACDFRLAAETARLGSMAVRRGLIGSGQTVMLARGIAFPKALELMLLGEHWPATELARWGVVNKVTPAADLMQEAFAWADKLCRNAPLAVRAHKEIAYRALAGPWADAVALEARYRLQLLETEDVLEGQRAFAERREPIWKGQ